MGKVLVKPQPEKTQAGKYAPASVQGSGDNGPFLLFGVQLSLYFM